MPAGSSPASRKIVADDALRPHRGHLRPLEPLASPRTSTSTSSEPSRRAGPSSSSPSERADRDPGRAGRHPRNRRRLLPGHARRRTCGRGGGRRRRASRPPRRRSSRPARSRARPARHLPLSLATSTCETEAEKLARAARGARPPRRRRPASCSTSSRPSREDIERDGRPLARARAGDLRTRGLGRGLAHALALRALGRAAATTFGAALALRTGMAAPLDRGGARGRDVATAGSTADRTRATKTWSSSRDAASGPGAPARASGRAGSWRRSSRVGSP